MLPSELSAEDRERLVEKWARRVVDRRLETPATLFLEMHKPLAFLGGQAMLVAAPILGNLFGYENMQQAALFLQNAENVEMLLRRIEEMSRERDAHEAGGETATPEGSS